MTSCVRLPAGSVDCHVHVFEPDRFAYTPARTYTPGPATLAELCALHDALGVQRVVLVQPSGYGSDNACLLQALAALGPARARGVAVLDAAQLALPTHPGWQAMHAAGVRSVRINLAVHGVHDAAVAQQALRDTLAAVQPWGWSVQMYVGLGLLPALAPLIAQATVPVVLDHFAGLVAAQGPKQAGFDLLLGWMAAGRVVVKLSAPSRASLRDDAADLVPLVRAMAAHAPQQLVWGSDWPHTRSRGARSGDLLCVEPFEPVDDALSLQRLREALADPQVFQAVMVDNPARLYGFDADPCPSATR